MADDGRLVSQMILIELPLFIFSFSESEKRRGHIKTSENSLIRLYDQGKNHVVAEGGPVIRGGGRGVAPCRKEKGRTKVKELKTCG